MHLHTRGRLIPTFGMQVANARESSESEMVDQVRIARQSNRVVRRWPRAQRAFGRLHANLYRISRGRFLPLWFAGAPVMVLETVGRRSGQKRATPVLYLRDGDA